MSDPSEWKFGQVFDRNPIVEETSDADLVSAVEFNDTGDYIATGDRGGRVVIFERDKEVTKSKKKASSAEYKFFIEFQSHELEFDYLKSLEIEEKINKIKWVNRLNNNHLLLTTNDKTIKLWRVHEKKVKHVVTSNIPQGGIQFSKPTITTQSLKLPRVQVRESIVTATGRKVYANAHAYHINSISVNSDGETYISSDDLRINLWKLSRSDQTFNIVDIKPTNMEELTEVITSAEFHPKHCNIFMHSSSKGTIKLADMRSAALCDTSAKVFEEPEDPANKSFFSEIISSISDIKFSNDGRYIISRDYLNLKLWDVNMEHKPVKSISIHDHLRSKLCDLYENDCIFDKFECTMNGDGTQMLTGSYNNRFNVYDKNGKCTSVEATKQTQNRKNSLTNKYKLLRKPKKEEPSPDTLEFTKKALHVAWHPKENLVAIGAASNLFIYTAY